MEVTMAKKFLRKRAVGERYSITDRSVERMSADGRLPKPVYRGRIPMWEEAELDQNDREAALRSRPKAEVTA
jgi:predicted DNA-binding transcriptional regulator AlpA